MKILILSDIHGNLNAFNAVKEDIKNYTIDACALLGDLIDYGMHSNEIIAGVQTLPYPVLCNIFGNHEDAILNQNYARFSSQRGRESAQYTRSKLNDASWQYIKNNMAESGKCEFIVNGKKFLAVHGSLKDNYWKSISFSDELEGYAQYDFVLSGHSHYPHFFEKFYDCDNPKTRNKKKTIFINPGSVGQPRNINKYAQYALLDTDTEELILKKVKYDIEEEQKAFKGQVDVFYKNRLSEGI